MQHLFNNPDFARHAGDGSAHYLDSPYIKGIDARLCGAISKPELNPHEAKVMLCVLGGDGVGLHDKSKASTGIIAGKVLNVPEHLVATNLSSLCIGFIGGSKEPGILTEAIALILDDFIKYLPSSDGTRALRSCVPGCSQGMRTFLRISFARVSLRPPHKDF